MTGRGKTHYRRLDNGQAVSAEDTYLMLMLYQHQRQSVRQIARRFSLRDSQVRTILGKRSGGSYCG